MVAVPLTGFRMSTVVLNIAAYLFTAIDNAAALRPVLHARALERGLKGTVLLAPEGINIFLAGDESALEAWLGELRADPRFASLQVKQQYSRTQPFARLKVKLKRELVPLGELNLPLAELEAPRLSPHELRHWLDEGRTVVLLDTRNQFEFEQGSFEAAQSLGLRCFRDFPAQVERQLAALRDTPIVTFCTGGIRCEKAAPLMLKMGFTEVYQLDGGILNYFKECGDAHYRGDCFVFDERVGVDSALAPQREVQAPDSGA